MLLEIDNLQTEFRTRSGTVRAVDGVSFGVHEGETLAVVGESGCGKSVTALSIMRLLSGPSAIAAGGRITFDGKDVLAMNKRQLRAFRGTGVAMVFQDPMSSLNPALTIGRQLTESLRLHLKMNRREAKERAIELLELVGISEPETRLKAYPHQFSGGMRQRVMIAIALSCSPKVLLADEITTALDVTIQAQILDLLRTLSAETGTAVVLITHDLGIVAGMAERVHVMYGGQIVEKATTEDLFDNPRMPYTWGLLGSIPRLDETRRTRLIPIEGTPPDLSDPPTGCRFRPRCAYARQICGELSPELTPVDSTGHEARCWGMQDTPDGGWLRDTDWRVLEQGRMGVQA